MVSVIPCVSAAIAITGHGNTGSSSGDESEVARDKVPATFADNEILLFFLSLFFSGSHFSILFFLLLFLYNTVFFSIIENEIAPELHLLKA